MLSATMYLKLGRPDYAAMLFPPILVGYFFHDLVHIDRFVFQLEVAVLQRGRLQQLGDHLEHLIGRGVNHVADLGHRRVSLYLLGEDFGELADSVQRVFHVVRREPEKLGLQLIGLSQLGVCLSKLVVQLLHPLLMIPQVQQIAHAHTKLARIERLGEVVVGAGL